jgi:hypothetical protein
LGAVDADALFIAGDEQGNGAAEIIAVPIEKSRHGGDEGGDGCLHVRGAPAIEHAVDDLGAERVHTPAFGRAHRDHVGMPGVAEIGLVGAEARIEIVDVVCARF